MRIITIKAACLFSIRYQHEQNCLLERMENLTKSFDKDLSALVDKKREISVELKYSELTMICFYEELQIITDTQEEENDLDGSVKILENVLAEIDAKVEP